jgi:hypothetical protein
MLPARRGGTERCRSLVDRASLLRRCGRKLTVGSNPTLSAPTVVATTSVSSVLAAPNSAGGARTVLAAPRPVPAAPRPVLAAPRPVLAADRPGIRLDSTAKTRATGWP